VTNPCTDASSPGDLVGLSSARSRGGVLSHRDVRGRLVESGEDVVANAFGGIVPPFERVRVDDVREQYAGACELGNGGVLALAAGNVLDSSDESPEKRPADRAPVAGMHDTVVCRTRVGMLCPASFDQTAGMLRQARVPAHRGRVPHWSLRKPAPNGQSSRISGVPGRSGEELLPTRFVHSWRQPVVAVIVSSGAPGPFSIQEAEMSGLCSRGSSATTPIDAAQSSMSDTPSA
jgi:hypothetical protein